MLLGELAAITNAVAWASGGILAKRLGPGVRPVHIVAAHTTTAVVLLSLILFATGQASSLFGMRPGTVGLLALTSLINSVGSFVFFVNISSGSVTRVYPVTQGLFILMTLLASWLLLGESIGPGVIAGAFAIVAGIVLLNYERRPPARGSHRPESSNLRLVLLGMTTAVFWAANLLLVAHTLEDAEPLPAAVVRNLVPAMGYMAFGFFRPWARLSAPGGADRAWLLAGGLFFAYAAGSFTVALANAPASVATILLNTSPLWAVLFGMLILREKMGPLAITGAACVLIGMMTTLLLS